jgi:hypothetical protein
VVATIEVVASMTLSFQVKGVPVCAERQAPMVDDRPEAVD